MAFTGVIEPVVDEIALGAVKPVSGNLNRRKQVIDYTAVGNGHLGYFTTRSVKKTGHPLKVNDKKICRLFDHLRSNLPLTKACALAKINYNTLRGWLSNGEKDTEEGLNTEYARFAEDFETAKAEGCKVLIDKWVAHCDNSWQAIAELSSRLYPNELGKSATINTNTSVRIDGSVKLSLEERISRYAEVIKAKTEELGDSQVNGEGRSLLPGIIDADYIE